MRALALALAFAGCMYEPSLPPSPFKGNATTGATRSAVCRPHAKDATGGSCIAALEDRLLRQVDARGRSRIERRVRATAPMIFRAAHRAGIDPALLGAVVMKESSYRQDARGSVGEIGLCQIKPGALAKTLCRGLDLRKADDNLLCGARYLARASKRCAGSPHRWLGQYNGVAKCGPSKYSRRVMAIAERGTR